MAAFADESSWSNEIGFAFAAIDDTVELRITGFDISIDDYQLERSVPQSADYIVINADKVSSQNRIGNRLASGPQFRAGRRYWPK